jgi:hypothetical protein
MKITKIFNKHEFVLLENTEGTIKNGQSRETDKTKQKHNTICVGQHYIIL